MRTLVVVNVENKSLQDHFMVFVKDCKCDGYFFHLLIFQAQRLEMHSITSCKQYSKRTTVIARMHEMWSC